MTVLDTTTGNPLSVAEWLEIKKTTLGASEVASALGLSPLTYKDATPIDMWQRKLGIAPPIVENEAMYWGKVLEPIVQAEFEKRHGVKLKTQLFVRHPDHPWLSATLDGFTADDEVVQIKTAGAFAKGWGATSDDEESDDVPIPYLVQTHQEMMCVGAKRAIVPVLIGGQRYREYRIAFDPEFAQRILAGAKRFWWCVQNHVCPDWGVLDARALAVLHPTCEGTVELDRVTLQRIEEYENAKDRIKEEKEHSEAIKVQILKELGSAQFGRLPDGRLIKRFRQEMPERTQVVSKHVRHYFSVLKGDSE